MSGGRADTLTSLCLVGNLGRRHFGQHNNVNEQMTIGMCDVFTVLYVADRTPSEKTTNKLSPQVQRTAAHPQSVRCEQRMPTVRGGCMMHRMCETRRKPDNLRCSMRRLNQAHRAKHGRKVIDSQRNYSEGQEGLMS